MSVVGARPQFVKAGPVSRALAERGLREILVTTGQHYDEMLSEAIARDVGLRPPDHDLGVGSGSHGEQTGRMLERLEALMVEVEPDAVLCFGDTNSTLAAALASSKLRIPTGHVEAGLRSRNRAMPEELNRVVTDHLSDALFAPTDLAMENLRAEGLADRATLTGDVMVDALQSIDLQRVPTPDWAREDFYIATLHRPSNTDDAEHLAMLLGSLDALDKRVHLLVHPRLELRMRSAGLTQFSGSLRLEPPLPYASMLGTMKASSGVLTDSGGLQKEAFILRVPCVTLRSETEWPETLAGGWNVLVDAPYLGLQQLANRVPHPVEMAPFGTGKAAQEITDQLDQAIRGRASS